MRGHSRVERADARRVRRDVRLVRRYARVVRGHSRVERGDVRFVGRYPAVKRGVFGCHVPADRRYLVRVSGDASAEVRVFRRHVSADGIDASFVGRYPAVKRGVFGCHVAADRRYLVRVSGDASVKRRVLRCHVAADRGYRCFVFLDAGRVGGDVRRVGRYFRLVCRDARLVRLYVRPVRRDSLVCRVELFSCYRLRARVVENRISDVGQLDGGSAAVQGDGSFRVVVFDGDIVQRL